MPAKDFDVGSLIWAKMKGFPPWPGKIIDPPADAKSPKQKKSQHYVYFFGSNNHAWILDENIFPHDNSMVQSANKKKSSAYQSAIETIVNQSKNAKRENTDAHKILKVKEQIADKESSQKETPNQSKLPKQNNSPSLDIAPNKSKVPNSVNNVPKKRLRVIKNCVKIEKSDVPVQRKTAKKRPSLDTKTAKKRPLIDTKTAKKQSLIETDSAKCAVSYPENELVENNNADLLASVPPNMSYPQIEAILQNDSRYHSPVQRPPTPLLDVSDITESVKENEITPCSKKIGFLGLGNMGQGIVKNLLNSGHHVTVWNRTPTKMDIFVNVGASRGRTPADVVQASDITFCCVSDPNAVKYIVFGNCGVLKGLCFSPDSNKGYVEMTSIDPETSKAVSDEITLRGGRYLEAPLTGSKQNAIEGSLLILTAGDRTLFTECETCFHAIAKTVFYMSSVVGTGSKMNLIHSVLHGSVYAALGEAMALIDCCKLSQAEFLRFLEFGPLSCKALLEKGHAIIERNYLTNTPLKHLEKDLRLGFILSTSVNQPLLVSSAVHGIYRRAMLRGYADHDVSAVYMGII